MLTWVMKLITRERFVIDFLETNRNTYNIRRFKASSENEQTR